MAKVTQDENYYFIRCACPSCGEHLIPKEKKPGAGWTFNGDFEKPTFTPSVRVSTPGSNPPYQCHFNITDGMISMHGDSTHGVVGTFPLQDFE